MEPNKRRWTTYHPIVIVSLFWESYTGKGNDQVRIEAYALIHNPKIKVSVPVREWDMDRNEQIKYAKANNIPVPASIDFPYSVDDNMWGMTWEG